MASSWSSLSSRPSKSYLDGSLASEPVLGPCFLSEFIVVVIEEDFPDTSALRMEYIEDDSAGVLVVLGVLIESCWELEEFRLALFLARSNFSKMDAW